MMVHLTLSLNQSSPNTIWKSLFEFENVNAELYDETDIMNPSFLLKWNNNYPVQVNYLYCQEFKRYYFVDKMIAEPGGAVRFDCHIDVLRTYAQTLDGLFLFISRTATEGGPTLIKDTQLPLSPEKIVNVQEFYQKNGNPFNIGSSASGKNFVLNVMGRRT